MEPMTWEERPTGMVASTRFAPAVVAVALVVSACAGAEGDVTTDTDLDANASTSESPSPQTSEPAPSEPPPGDSGSDESSGPTEPGAEPGDPATDLAIVLDPGSGELVEWTITCDPAGGSMSDPASACETLISIGPRDVAPVPKDASCTMQYGGPQTARVTGTWNGTKVDLTFSRQNGCEIARWDTMDPVLPVGDGALL
jgi:hypothetical protein